MTESLAEKRARKAEEERAKKSLMAPKYDENGVIINTSGLRPVEYKVVLRLDSVERTSQGGILIPERIRDKELRARTVATIAAVGGSCFQDPDWNEPKPKIGDRVLIGRYVGE